MTVRILTGDCRDVLKTLPDESVHCVVTSPPYFNLRDYGTVGQIGLEPTPDAYVAELVAVFREVHRVLRKDGTIWIVIGDSYARTGGTDRTVSATARTGNTRRTIEMIADRTSTTPVGLKPKDLIGIPWMVAFALRADGWWLRKDNIWAKGNPMPESVEDRTTSSHEYVFHFSKSERYFYDAEAIKEGSVSDYPSGNGFKRPQQISRGGRGKDEEWTDVGGTRNRRSVWNINTRPFPDAHFAVMPADLAELCIKAGTSERGCCPDCGAPWARVVETESRPNWQGEGQKHDGTYYRANPGGGVGNDARAKRFSGWQPSCSCPERQPVPATVLDPFFGAGTTGLVADRLQRSCIGIELNPDYAAMAEKRIRGDAPLFAETAA